MRLRTTAVLLAAAMAVATHPAEGPGYHHPDPDREVFFAETPAWFTASAPTRVGNVDHEQGAYMGWDDSEPTDPVGGATVATAASGFQSITDEERFDNGQFTASGTVTGYLDSIVLDLYYQSPVADFCGMTAAVDLDVDGVSMLDMDGIAGRIDVATEPAGNGTLVKLRLTEVFAQLERYADFGFDFVGDETTEHTIDLSVQQYPLCNEVIWRYDSTEFPAAITFNQDPADGSLDGHTTIDVRNPPAPAG